MKKRRILCVLLLIFVLLFAFAACDAANLGPVGGETSEGGEETETEPEGGQGSEGEGGEGTETNPEGGQGSEGEGGEETETEPEGGEETEGEETEPEGGQGSEGEGGEGTETEPEGGEETEGEGGEETETEPEGGEETEGEETDPEGGQGSEGEGEEEGGGEEVKTEVTLTASKVLLSERGQDYSLLTATSTGGGKITWSTSDPAVVDIWENPSENVALVMALGRGTATITATDEWGQTAECTLRVGEFTVKIEGDTVVNGELILFRTGTTEYESATLTATVFFEGEACDAPVTWRSSDESVVSVENGVLTAHAIGTASVYASCGVTGSRVAVSVQWKEKPEGLYSIAESGASGAHASPRQWTWQGDNGMGGSRPSVTGDGRGTQGEIDFYITGNTGWRWYGVQLFYWEPSLKPDTFYKLDLTLSSSIDSFITVNDTQVELKKGENAFTVYYRESADNASVRIVLAVNDIMRGSVGPLTDEDGNFIQFRAGDLSVLRMVWTEYTPEQLATPVGFAIAEDGEFTVTDTNPNEKIEGYVLGFFEEGKEEPTYTQPIMKPVEGRNILGDRGGITLFPDERGEVAVNAGKMYLDDSFLPAGTYTVKVKAYSGVARYADSGWSEAAQPYTKTGEVAYRTLPTYRAVDRGLGRYYIWSEWDLFDYEKCFFKDNTLTLKVMGQADWYSNQVLYEAAGLVYGHHYTVTFTFDGVDEFGETLDLTGKQMIVNGTRVRLEKGEKNVLVNFTYLGGAAITILLGQPTEDWQGTVLEGGLPAGVYTFANIKLRTMEESVGEQDDGVMCFGDNSVAMPLQHDKLMYWFATDPSWSDDGSGAWTANGVDLRSWSHEENEESGTGYTYRFSYRVSPLEGKCCSWVARFWYKNSANFRGAPYNLELTIVSDEEGDAVINGKIVHIEKGEKTYTVNYTEGDVSLAIVLATDYSMMGADADGIDITFKSVKWTLGGAE